MKSKLVLILLVFMGLTLILSSRTLSAQGLHAGNDTVQIVPGIPVTINLLANDIYPAGDSLRVWFSGTSGINVVSHIQGTYTFLIPYWGFPAVIHTHYVIVDFTIPDTSSALVVFYNHDRSYDSLDINNVSARFEAWGTHFQNPSDWPGFIVPKGSGHSTIFSCSPWFGGLDPANKHHVAAQRYGQGPANGNGRTHFDFFAGPVMDSANYSIYQDSAWNYVWNLKKSDIEYHKAHWHDAGYIPVHDILTWPGNGNPALGELSQLAPYYDNDGDSTYNPMHGDYPLIMGDQSLYFIFNDDRNFHAESTGNKLGIEVHGMAYGFDLPQDSAFNNTVFLDYKIINRSATTYHNTWFGLFTDLDIGYALDDYIGCDVQRNSYIGYNGDPVDGDGTGRSYGAHPPAEAVTFLSGPYKDADGIDNPAKDNNGHQLCNESVTGFHFGDNVTDNEELGLTTFMYTNNSGVPSYMTDPTGTNNGLDYYNCMQAIWKDSTHMIYGGDGHLSEGGYGPNCNFIFPGMSDTLNWGVGCQQPNGAENWTEVTASNAPNDRRGIGSVGPFTFKPGDVEDMTVAFVFARDYTGSDQSLAKVGQMIDIIRKAYNTNILPNGQSFNGMNEIKPASALALSVYPNPSNGKIRIGFGKYLSDNIRVTVTDMKGSIVFLADETVHSDILDMDLSILGHGLYILNVSTSSASMKQKISIIK